MPAVASVLYMYRRSLAPSPNKWWSGQGLRTEPSKSPTGSPAFAKCERRKENWAGSLFHQYARRYSDEPLTFGGCSHAGSSTGLAAGASHVEAGDDAIDVLLKGLFSERPGVPLPRGVLGTFHPTNPY